MAFVGGHHCAVCGQWVGSHQMHSCGGLTTFPTPPVVFTPPSPMKTGWLCPACGKGNAPWIPYCHFCDKTPTPATTTDVVPKEEAA